MRDKNVFVYKPFLFSRISDLSLFLCKNCNTTETCDPYLSQQPLSEILRSEDCDPANLLLFENLVGQGRGVHTMKFVWA